VTGAASGIGRALADRFAAEGIRVVLADVEQDALDAATAAIRATGAEVLAMRTDVTKAEQLRALAEATMDTFGRVDIVCANAGVSAMEGRIWETTERELEWITAVNLFGVIHTIRAFIPGMIGAGLPGHFVVTASNAAFHSGPMLNIYAATKSGVVRIAEGLHYELRQIDSKINVSILVPGTVRTGIVEADRNSPSDMNIDLDEATVGAREARRAGWKQFYDSPRTIGPEAVADQTWDAIQKNHFYIFTHPAVKQNIQKRTKELIEERTPVEIPLYAES
jgi:NAD(P)-dependent dehydrogenase (short-subunit alcohol dehydrogenase family)